MQVIHSNGAKTAVLKQSSSQVTNPTTHLQVQRQLFSRTLKEIHHINVSNKIHAFRVKFIQA